MSDNIAIQADEWRKYIFTPSDKQVYAQTVHATRGDVAGADHILRADSRAARISYPQGGGEKSYLILDLGPAARADILYFR